MRFPALTATLTILLLLTAYCKHPDNRSENSSSKIAEPIEENSDTQTTPQTQAKAKELKELTAKLIKSLENDPSEEAQILLPFIKPIESLTHDDFANVLASTAIQYIKVKIPEDPNGTQKPNRSLQVASSFLTMMGTIGTGVAALKLQKHPRKLNASLLSISLVLLMGGAIYMDGDPGENSQHALGGILYGVGSANMLLGLSMLHDHFKTTTTGNASSTNPLVANNIEAPIEQRPITTIAGEASVTAPRKLARDNLGFRRLGQSPNPFTRPPGTFGSWEGTGIIGLGIFGKSVFNLMTTMGDVGDVLDILQAQEPEGDYGTKDRSFFADELRKLQEKSNIHPREQNAHANKIDAFQKLLEQWKPNKGANLSDFIRGQIDYQVGFKLNQEIISKGILGNIDATAVADFFKILQTNEAFLGSMFEHFKGVVKNLRGFILSFILGRVESFIASGIAKQEKLLADLQEKNPDNLSPEAKNMAVEALEKQIAIARKENLAGVTLLRAVLNSPSLENYLARLSKVNPGDLTDIFKLFEELSRIYGDPVNHTASSESTQPELARRMKMIFEKLANIDIKKIQKLQGFFSLFFEVSIDPKLEAIIREIITENFALDDPLRKKLLEGDLAKTLRTHSEYLRGIINTHPDHLKSIFAEMSQVDFEKIIREIQAIKTLKAQQNHVEVRKKIRQLVFENFQKLQPQTIFGVQTILEPLLRYDPDMFQFFEQDVHDLAKKSVDLQTLLKQLLALDPGEYQKVLAWYAENEPDALERFEEEYKRASEASEIRQLVVDERASQTEIAEQIRRMEEGGSEKYRIAEKRVEIVEKHVSEILSRIDRLTLERMQDSTRPRTIAEISRIYGNQETIQAYKERLANIRYEPMKAAKIKPSRFLHPALGGLFPIFAGAAINVAAQELYLTEEGTGDESLQAYLQKIGELVDSIALRSPQP